MKFDNTVVFYMLLLIKSIDGDEFTSISSSISYAPCEQLNYCSEHGVCINDGSECMCESRYDGSDCSACAAGYFQYPACYDCERFCHNGGTCTNGTCLCTERFNGSFCDDCADNYYGPSCTQDPVGFSISYNESMYDVSEAPIIIRGAYFNTSANNDQVRCRFRGVQYGNIDYSSSAIVINSTTLICISPRAWPQWYAVAFSFDNGTNWFGPEQSVEWNFRVYFRAFCPNSLNDCSYRGYCVLGQCFCNADRLDPEENCGRCRNGYFSFPSCYSCETDCHNNGTCTNGTCICTEHFQGVRCTECKAHYYGNNCQKIPVILPVYAVYIDDVGGFNLTIDGDNLDDNVSSVICQYRLHNHQLAESEGWVMNSTTIVCWVPPMNASAGYLHISIDNGTSWLSPQWIKVVSTCPSEARGCSDHGQCSFRRCNCYFQYSGNYCTSCADGYFNYPECIPCSSYCERNNRGRCDADNDTCVCSDPTRFTGAYCDRCQPHHYGNNCTFAPQLFSITPTYIADIYARDGIDILLYGDNFVFNSLASVLCRFQAEYTWTVPVSSINSTHAICLLSNYTGVVSVSLELSLDHGTTWITSDSNWTRQVSIYYQCPVRGRCFGGSCRLGGCLCQTGYAGRLCDECEPDYVRWTYGSCYKCSDYCQNNGTCANSTCMCQKHFIGTFCDTCEPNYFGPLCLPYPIIQSVDPSWFYDVGGITITVHGFNFNSSEMVGQKSCYFIPNSNSMNGSMASATIIDDRRLTCFVPVKTLDTQSYWSLGIMINGSREVYQTFNLQVLAKCPRLTNCRPYGRCLFGTCQCTSPYYGPSCEYYPSPPVFDPLPLFIIKEFDTTSIDLASFMVSGGPPFRYRFQNMGSSASVNFYYNCLMLNESTGMINITQAIASSENYTYSVLVSNALSTTYVSLAIQVFPSYSASVSWKQSGQYLSAKMNHILEYSGNSTAPNMSINIWIDSHRRVSIETDDRGQFTSSYSLSSQSFGGRLRIAASHPAFTVAPTYQDSVFIEYLRLSFSNSVYSFYSAYPTNFTNFVTIHNQGDFDLTNLTFELKHGLPCIQSYSISPTVIDTLPPLSSRNISLFILSNCSISNGYLTFSVNDSRLSALTSSVMTIESIWSCRMRNHCNNHGLCVGNETCQCTNPYSGDACQQCAPNLFAYPSCTTCPTCVRGRSICNATVAQCDCIDLTRVYGTLCQYCYSGYYGANCEPISVVFTLSPTSGLELANDTRVTIIGDNFRNVSSFCLLDSANRTQSIPAKVINSQQIICIFPSHFAETIRVRLMQNNSVVPSETTLIYRYLPSCPSTGCGQGECVMGTCRCRYPYFGINCTSLPMAPIFRSIPDITLREMSPLYLNLSEYLLQGDSPFEWYLGGTIPLGLSVDEFSSLLTWNSAIASSENYLITVNVRQTTTGTVSQQTLTMKVPLSYNVTVRFQQSGRILTPTSPVTILGQINAFDSSAQTNTSRSALVWLCINGIRRYLPIVRISAASITFTVNYTALTSEYGTLSLGAAHPAAPKNNLIQDYVTLFGLRSQLAISGIVQIRVGDNHLNTFSSIAFLSNPCNYSVENINISLTSPRTAVSFFNLSSSNCSFAVIPPLTTCSIDMAIRFNRTGSGYLVFTLTNTIIEPIILSIPIRAIADRAEFVLSPSSSSFILPRNSQQTVVITLFNIGSLPLGPLRILLPNQNYTSAVTSEISSVSVASNTTFTLTIQATDVAPLSTFNVRGSVIDDQSFFSKTFDLSLTIVGSNDTLVNINFICQDELSYYGNNKMNLANVTISLVSAVLKVKYVLFTNQTGQASISVVAGIYEIRAQAFKHSSFFTVLALDQSVEFSKEITIFLQRLDVSYTFSVKKVSTEETYTITLESTFETHVPAVGLLVSPNIIDLDQLVDHENITQIDLTLTNVGLLKLFNVQMILPASHPYLRFTLRPFPIGDIEGNTSIVTVIDIHRNNSSRAKRGIVIESLSKWVAQYISGGIRYLVGNEPIFIVNRLKDVSAATEIITNVIQQRIGMHNVPGSHSPTTASEGRETQIFETLPFVFSAESFIEPMVNLIGSEFAIVPITMTPPTCESCVSGILQCLATALPYLNLLDECLSSVSLVFDTIFDNTQETLVDGKVDLLALIELMQSLWSMSSHIKNCLSGIYSWKSIKFFGPFKIFECVDTIVVNCLMPQLESEISERGRRNSLSVNGADSTLMQLSFVANSMRNLQDLFTLIYADKSWIDLSCDDKSWNDAVTQAQQSTSDMSYLISREEYDDLVSTPHQCANNSMITNYLLYYNRTINHYMLNITEPIGSSGSISSFMSLSEFANRSRQYRIDSNHVRMAWNYPNLIQGSYVILDKYYKTHKESPVGVCATVKIQILQRVTITRQGFDAELTINNGGTDRLDHIEINLSVFTENGLNVTDRFSIGMALLSGDLNNGTLQAGQSGQINWLLIPYRTAAPTTATWYRVGGQLSYMIDGQRVNITLQPDSILVEPEAQLDIAYFLEQRIIGPDPLSNETIAPQPFVLALVITNNGYGSVTNFRIMSGQPTIVDNEKGLAVNFRITEMKINQEQTARVELSATLGNLPSFSSTTITWTMLASLMGQFRSFNASYAETNPNGDTKLSLINSLTTHRLQHTVSLDILVEQLNDNRIDYLVSRPDGTEAVYSSTNATLFFPVYVVQGTIQSFSVDPSTQRLEITMFTPNGSFFHLTLNNSNPSHSIVSAKRIGDDLNMTVNAWITNYIHHLESGVYRENLLHVFDKPLSSSSSQSYEILLRANGMTVIGSDPMSTEVTASTSSSTSDQVSSQVSGYTLNSEIVSHYFSSKPSDGSSAPSSQISFSQFSQTTVSSIMQTSSSLIRLTDNHMRETLTSSDETFSSMSNTAIYGDLSTERVSNTESSLTLMSTTWLTFTAQTTISPQRLTVSTVESTSVTTVLPSKSNYYIEFSLGPLVIDFTQTIPDITRELLLIFISALHINDNQVNITINLERAYGANSAQIFLYNTMTESAESLLNRTREKLADVTSEFRQHNMTHLLNSDSISNIKIRYICSNGITQETPCTSATTTTTTATSLGTTIALNPGLLSSVLLALMILS